ncbi:sphingoid long chain base kinase-like protein [Ampelomyces quisqualis]|uniref:Sphingoid long chain base kinase-like protein n=1 Tax=Ampelomyces quisqualis TaxID=50730 RepID=A0A6A5QA79_AMPQU|nr:sphingoid long chain base kinase-like protein [Ampelomyces quisqualis]
MTLSAGGDDPFRDPSSAPRARQPPDDARGEPDVPDTLAVGRHASLSLGTDALIVLEDKATRSIPFFNILWADHGDDGDVTIQYAQPAAKKSVRPAIVSYKLDKPDSRLAEAWVARLLDRAYGPSQRQKRIKVLINPFGGQGGAVKTYHKSVAPILAAARCELDVQKTEHQGHGIEIAQNMDIDAYDVVACCSGDGIPHEVWNGLAKRQDAARALHKMAVAQLPCGSGNAASLNFNGTDNPSLAALAIVKGLRTPLDLSSVSQGNDRFLSFLSQSVGIVAETDLATEHLRWMGSARFTWGFLVRLINKTVYPADIAIQVEHATKSAVRSAYRTEASKSPRAFDDRPVPSSSTGLPELKHGTINDPLPPDWHLVPHSHLGNFYAGNIAYMSPGANFFPASLPSDGCLDLVRIRGDIPRHTAIKTLLAVENNTFFDLEHVDYQKVCAYRIIPRHQKTGYISIDGERVAFEPFQVEVHRGLGTVLSRSGRLCEAKGV